MYIRCVFAAIACMKPWLVLGADFCASGFVEAESAGVCEFPPAQPAKNTTSATAEALRAKMEVPT
jgi:hypothetical protein